MEEPGPHVSLRGWQMTVNLTGGAAEMTGTPTLNCCSFSFFFIFFTAAPAAYGGSQVNGQIGATAVSLYHSHSNPGSEAHQ